MKKITLCSGLALISAFITSCDPAIGVALHNNTGTDKHITVIYPANFVFPCDTITGQHNHILCDSVKTYAWTAKTGSHHIVVIPKETWDTVTRTYSFTLQPDYVAIVEARSFAGSPTFGQKFIIDRTDTIELKKNNKSFTKKPMFVLGGSWVHQINERSQN